VIWLACAVNARTRRRETAFEQASRLPAQLLLFLGEFEIHRLTFMRRSFCV
jgi:hypothetical protein